MKVFGASFLVMVLMTVPVFAQGAPQIKKGAGERVSFNRVSVVIPEGWFYSSNPRAKPGTDQLQLYSEDRNRTILITLTKARADVDFIEVEHAGRFEMLRRAMSIPGFEKCVVSGTAGPENLWKRQGIFTRFDLFKDESQKADEIMMRVYNYGEELPSLGEVLFMTAFIIGEDTDDAHTLVRSLEILE
jgi:hypothetical protein